MQVCYSRMMATKRSPSKSSFFVDAQKPKLLLVVVAIILSVTIYINVTLVTNASVSQSHRLQLSRSHLDLYNDTELYKKSLENTTHPESIFYRRGKSFDPTVSRECSILVCLHDKIVNMGLSLIRELRCLGNQELIQVYHCGKEELSGKSISYILKLDNRVELVDVCSDLSSRGIILADMAKTFRNWWIKPLAIYHTDVRHVVLLDADDILLRDPAIVRSLDGYVKTGTTFFYDRVRPGKRFLTGSDNDEKYLHKLLHQFNYTKFNVSEGFAPSQHMLNTFAYRGLSIQEMDSSMVLIDKERAGKAVMNILFWFITEERFRFRYSWSDKETFWLAFELARVSYSFSPWGVSVVDSMPNEDMKNHPNTLCGSTLHFMPVQDSKEQTPEILYLNGKALIDPYPQGYKHIEKNKQNALFNTVSSHMTPRQKRRQTDKAVYPGMKFNLECLVGMGATPLPKYFSQHLLRRRLHFFGLAMGVLGSLQHCETYVSTAFLPLSVLSHNTEPPAKVAH